jgi:subtilisin family serine protease
MVKFAYSPEKSRTLEHTISYQMRYTLFALLFAFSLQINAQKNANVPLSLTMLTSGFPATEMIGVLAEGNPATIEAAVKKHGGFVMHNEGMISSVQIPAGKLNAFANEDGVVRLGNAPIHQQVMNDTLKKQTRVNDVRNGLSPLPQGYTGAGIVMGIIDSGIDYKHPDFKDSLGNTRIYRIWDQRDQTGNSPAIFNYGTEWDSASINDSTCTHNDLAYYGHGTHVSGIAGGNGRSVTQMDMSGVAPNVTFVVVALDFNGQFSSVAVADAAAYIYSIADSLGMPCVINASVGDYYGSHDGQDLQARMIDTLLDTPGRLMVGAAGNAGGLPIHLSYNLSSDTNFTWFNVNSGSIYIQMWAEQSQFAGADFAIGATRMNDFTDLDRTSFTDIAGNISGISYDTLYNSNGQRLATIMRIATTQGSAYSMEYYVTPDSAAGYNYGLYCTGSGLFHLWSFDVISSGIPNTSQYAPITSYKMPDATHNIVSSFQCSERVVCVANYVNRDVWPNYNNIWIHDTTVTAGALMYNSSIGPTRDGRIKPEIAAPGANNFSCIETNNRPGIISGAPDAVTPGGWHVQGGGTSAASPVVAGCGALWLERLPNSTWNEFRHAVIFCAKQDTFTGNALPDVEWGYGKVDAFSMMTVCATSLNQSELPNESTLNVFPVPANSQTTVFISGMNGNESFNIVNAMGQTVFTGSSDANGNAGIPAGVLSSGFYSVVVFATDGIQSAQLIIE